MSYRDETDALRAECAALEDELREKNEQLRKLEKRIQKLRKRKAERVPAEIGEAEQASRAPIGRTVPAVPSNFGWFALLMGVVMIVGFSVGWVWAIDLGIVSAFLVAMLKDLVPRKLRELVISEDGLWVVSGSERSGWSWDEIEDAVVVKLDDDKFQLRLLQQGHWEDVDGRWNAHAEEFSEVVATWLAFERTLRRKLRVRVAEQELAEQPATQQRRGELPTTCRDESDAVRAQRDALAEELRTKDERLHRLEKQLRRLKKRAEPEPDTQALPAAPDPQRIPSKGSELSKALLAVGIGTVYLAGGGWLAIILGILLAISILQTFRKRSRELEISRAGVWVVSGTRRTGYAWDEIDKAVVVQRAGGAVQLRLHRQGRWQDIAGKWKIEPEELSSMLTSWLSFEHSRQPKLRVAAAEREAEVEQDDRAFEEQSAADDPPAERPRSRAGPG